MPSHLNRIPRIGRHAALGGQLNLERVCAPGLPLAGDPQTDHGRRHVRVPGERGPGAVVTLGNKDPKALRTNHSAIVAPAIVHSKCFVAPRND